MEHKKLSRILILAGAIALMGGAVIIIFLLPMLFSNYCTRFPDAKILYVPTMIYAWVFALVCGLALCQYMAISLRIGSNKSFCAENVKGLKTIALLLFIGAGMLLVYCFAAFLPYMFVVPMVVDLVIIAMAMTALGLLAWALHKLLRRAVLLQEENDLTI